MQDKLPCPQLNSTETESKPFETLKDGANHHIHVECKIDFESCPERVTVEGRTKNSSGEWKCAIVLKKLKKKGFSDDCYIDGKGDNRVRLESNKEYRIVTDKPGVEVRIDTVGLQGNIKNEIDIAERPYK